MLLGLCHKFHFVAHFMVAIVKSSALGCWRFSNNALTLLLFTHRIVAISKFFPNSVLLSIWKKNSFMQQQKCVSLLLNILHEMILQVAYNVIKSWSVFIIYLFKTTKWQLELLKNNFRHLWSFDIFLIIFTALT